MVALAVIIGLIYYLSIVNSIKQGVHAQESDLLQAQMVRDAIYACYGDILHESALNTSECRNGRNLTIPTDHAMGWQVSMLEYHNCTAKNWSSTNITLLTGRFSQKVVYAVPIVQRDDKLTCPGQLEVYI